MIISASRRTDIPAFYTEWLMQRLREQECIVVNPFNKNQKTIISLHPDNVDAIVFWTKNAAPIIKHLPEIEQIGHRFYFQYTVTGYDQLFEPTVPLLSQRILTFRQLAEAIGPEKVIWRYDPIVLSNVTDESYHLEKFSYILGQLRDFCCRIVISIVDDYRKARINFKRLADKGVKIRLIKEKTEVAELITGLFHKAQVAGLPIFSCAEPFDLSCYGVRAGKCIDDDLLIKLFNICVEEGKDRNQREACGCIKSKDIGQYDTCLHGCAYCYAVTPAKSKTGL